MTNPADGLICDAIVRFTDTILSCFNTSEELPPATSRAEAKLLKKIRETPLKVRRSEEVGTEFYNARQAVLTESESEYDEVYKQLLIASRLKRKQSPFKDDQVPSTSRASVPESSCHLLKETLCIEVQPKKKASSKEANLTKSTSIAEERVSDASTGAIPKLVTKRVTDAPKRVTDAPKRVIDASTGAIPKVVTSRGATPKSVLETPKGGKPQLVRQVSNQDTHGQGFQETSRALAAQEATQPGPKPQRAFQEASRALAAQEQTKPGPKPQRAFQEASRALAAQEETKPDPKPQRAFQEASRALAAQEETKPGPKPQRAFQEASRALAAQEETEPGPKPQRDFQEASRAAAAQVEPQPGSSRLNSAEPKPRLYYQQTRAIQTDLEDFLKPVDKLAPSKQYYQVPRASQTSFESSSNSLEEPKKVQKITSKDCPARSVFELLAAAALVSSGERHSFTPVADLRDRYIDALYQKFLEERNGPRSDPPSPAPQDAQLNQLRQVYVDRFEGFVPTLTGLTPYQDPRIVDFILERHQPESNRSILNRKFRRQHTQTTSTDNILPDKYGRPQRVEPNKQKKYYCGGGGRLARASSHSGEAEWYCRRLYDQLHSRQQLNKTTVLWSPEPFEQDTVTEDEIINADVIKYRKRSSKTFLNVSPEVPEKQLKETFRVANQVSISPVRAGSQEPSVKQEEPLVHRRPKLGASPLRQLEGRSEQENQNFGQSRHHRSRDRIRSNMGRMNALDDHERKIIIEFCHLLEKSKQLFNGLRELPQYGHKQWHAYFGKTFDVYTKLWKFQQQHRAILDSKYGLKRWQIGEIASKIGQLYYHFYLRTSDTAYLNEAFSFYYAIRGRSYYTQACKEDKCELIVKKLRYYARFIVASLLLKKVNLVRDLLRELDKQIIEYGNTYEPDDQNEWRIVADEVRAFIEVETVVDVTHPREYSCLLSHRLSAPIAALNPPALDRTSSPLTLTLREALIIGSNSTQLKFSELTIDMYRIMQTLEREPNTDVNQLYDESPRQRNPPTPSAINNKGYNLDGTYNTGEAPHKHMLFKPSPNQIFLYLSSAIDDLPPNGVVLLYISAEGLIVPNSKHPEEAGGYDMGGLITTSKTDVLTSSSKDAKGLTPKLKEAPVLHPGDLYPFTRRPMFVIVDSDNSFIFNTLPRFFAQPLIILMSPIEVPVTLFEHTSDQRMGGSLFTLFLHDPLSAVCLCCDIKRMPLEEWQRAQATIDGYLKEAGILLTRMRECTYVQFLSDDFLRLLILRFIFCETILRMHRMFRGRAQRTRCSPTIPDDLYEHPILTRIVMDLATKLQVRGHFHDPAAVQRE